LTEFDAILIVDSDMIVRGDLTHLFKLPTDFAWSLEAGPGIDYESGGGAGAPPPPAPQQNSSLWSEPR